jgi:hypothetical protein
LHALARLIQSLRTHGIRATAARIVEGVAWRTAGLREWPGQTVRRIRRVADAEFDRKYGVETSGVIGIRRLDVSPDQKEAGFQYEPTPALALQAMLKALPIRHEEFTFIDYGSGKGRVLLLASEYPYKRIVGVEASRQLHDIALRNFDAWKNPNQRCFRLESVCMDARDFPLPDGPLMIFFFTPFRPPVTDQVVDNIRKSLAADPRPVRMVHYGTNEEFRSLLTTLNFESVEIYSARPFSAELKYTGVLYSNGL